MVAVERIDSELSVLLHPDSMIAFCESQEAYEEYVWSIKRAENVRKKKSFRKKIILLQERKRKRERKKKRKRKKEGTHAASMEMSRSTIKDKFHHLSRKLTFLHKHVRCAQPNWMKLMKTTSVEMMLEENLEDDCGGDAYNAKCQGFGQKLAEQVHDELNKNS